MDPLVHIEAVAARAAKVNLTLAALCARAGVKRHVISRWRSGDVSPTAKVFDREMAKLERELCREERRLWRHLRRTYGPRVRVDARSAVPA